MRFAADARFGADLLLGGENYCANNSARLCHKVKAIFRRLCGRGLGGKVEYLFHPLVTEGTESRVKGRHRFACSCGCGGIQYTATRKGAIGGSYKLALSLTHLGVGEFHSLHRGQALGNALHLGRGENAYCSEAFIKEGFKLFLRQMLDFFGVITACLVKVYKADVNRVKTVFSCKHIGGNISFAADLGNLAFSRVMRVRLNRSGNGNTVTRQILNPAHKLKDPFATYKTVA